MNICLNIADLSVAFKKKEVLHHVTLPIYEHKITAIIGMSGCGKTTLLRVLNRSIEHDKPCLTGDVELYGQSIFSLEGEKLRKEIGLIFQKPVPFPFSIEKNITYALNYQGITKKKEQQEIISRCLKDVSLYDEVCQNLQADAETLSGGQQQRLCIARALAIKPKVLLLDEPCSALDIKNMLQIENTLLRIKEQCTIVIVTHNLSQAKRIADYTVYMEEGKVIEHNTTAELFAHPQEKQTKAYLEFIQ